MTVHFNAYFYGEITFILVNGETSKRQEKRLAAGKRNGLSTKYNLPHDSREG